MKENATNNGTIINNGSFLIAGAWVNNGTYDAGTGDFTLNSPGDQIVNHNAQSFERLIIRGGGNKIFQADITINDNINLQDGILISQNGARLIIGENAQVTGGSSDSYIAGPLFMYVNDDAFYPIGTSSVYLPVSLSNIDGTNALLGFEALSPNPIAAFNTTTIDQISSDHAWQLSVEQGPFNGALITLPIVNQTFIDDINNAFVIQSVGTDNTYESIGQSSSSGSGIMGEIVSAANGTGPYFSIGYLSELVSPNSAISVINAITPSTRDGKHDFLKIENIELYPVNKVSIYNRWGDLVFEINGYNNNDIIFTGESNVGSTKTLDNGTYFYAIEAGGEVKSGFFVIKR